MLCVLLSFATDTELTPTHAERGRRCTYPFFGMSGDIGSVGSSIIFLGFCCTQQTTKHRIAYELVPIECSQAEWTSKREFGETFASLLRIILCIHGCLCVRLIFWGFLATDFWFVNLIAGVELSKRPTLWSMMWLRIWKLFWCNICLNWHRCNQVSIYIFFSWCRHREKLIEGTSALKMAQQKSNKQNGKIVAWKYIVWWRCLGNTITWKLFWFKMLRTHLVPPSPMPSTSNSAANLTAEWKFREFKFKRRRKKNHNKFHASKPQSNNNVLLWGFKLIWGKNSRFDKQLKCSRNVINIQIVERSINLLHLLSVNCWKLRQSVKVAHDTPRKLLLCVVAVRVPKTNISCIE